MENLTPIDNHLVQSKIYTIRNTQVMLERGLAQLYGVETRRQNEQIKRNIARFPESFMFQMTKQELQSWVSHWPSACCRVDNLYSVLNTHGEYVFPTHVSAERED